MSQLVSKFVVVPVEDLPSTESSEAPLWGRSLRFVLLEQIRVRGEMSVAEMVTYLACTGFEVIGRPSKVVSDCLRWEVARGRVKRVRRGVYVYGKTPRTTERRVRVFARRCEEWVVAVMRSEVPPPTPGIRRDRWDPNWIEPFHDPAWPPWFAMGWLWTT